MIDQYNQNTDNPLDKYDLSNKNLNTKIEFIINYINNETPLTTDLSSEDKEALVKIINDNNITSLEINKQPRFWFYKSNILKTKEKQTLT